MKALVKTGPGVGNLAVREVPEPEAGTGHVVIRVAAGGMCGTDLHIADGSLEVRTPRILGHELSGTIAAIGEGVEGFAIGQRVTTETDASFCGTCAFCLTGDMHLCSKRTGIGTTADGGFAEFVAVRAGGVHILPANVSLLSGALTEPLAVAVRAVVERGHLQAGERVAVIGPGTVGLLVAQVARAQGATVMLVGLAGHRQRFRLAAELGINSTLVLDDPASAAEVDAAGGTMDLVFECSGAVAALERASRLVGKGGRVVLIGFFGTKVTLDLDSIINREVSMVASRGKRPTSFHMALELMASGQVDPGRLITRRFPLEAWQAAFEAAHELGSKVVLEV